MDVLNTISASGGRRYYRLGDLPPADYAPKAYVDLIAEYGPAYERLQSLRDSESKVTSELKRADATWLTEAASAAREGKTLKDPRPAISARLEKAQAEAAVAEQVCVDLSSAIYDVRNDADAQGWWKGATDAAREELLDRAKRQRDELEDTLAECAGVDWIAAWARGSHKPSRAVLGVPELGKLEKLIADRADKTPHIYVSSAQNRKLRAGEDAVDVNGNPVTYEQADHAYRLKRLHVNPGKPKPRESTGFGELA